MNEKAKELGLQNTHFVTPHGLDNPEHYTTPFELAILTDYALEDKRFAEIVNTKNYTISINGYPKVLNNTNELLGYLNGVNGVKTGFTNNAGRCLVTSTTRNNHQIITVVLGADTKKIRTKDSISLIEYAFSQFDRINLTELVDKKYKEWQQVYLEKINVIKGEDKKLITNIESLEYDKYPIKKEDVKDIKITVDCIDELQAPVKEGTNIR